MVAIKLKNVSIKSGDRFRNNQNYTMTFGKKDEIDENSTVDDIKDLIISKYSNRVVLNKSSQIEIVSVNENNQFRIGDKVIKNEETWEPNDFDGWGRGIGVGVIVEPPFEMKEGEVDVRWPGGRCFEFTYQLRKVN